MLPLRSGKRVVDHARAEPDEAETYGAVANEAAKLIPQECEERTRVGSRGGMVNRISSKSTVVYAIGSIPLSICESEARKRCVRYQHCTTDRVVFLA